MKNLSPTLIKTWLFLINSQSPELHKARKSAFDHIKRYFGTPELASLYIEQTNDNTVEIVFL